MKKIVLLSCILYIICSETYALETHKIEHREGYIAKKNFNQEYNNPDVKIQEIENYIEIAEPYELSEIYKLQQKEKENIKLKNREIASLKNKYNEGTIEQKVYEEKLKMLRDELAEYDIALIKSNKMSKRDSTDQERFLASIRADNISQTDLYGVPHNLIEEKFGNPDFIEYDNKTHNIVWGYFGWAEKFIGYDKDKIGETKTTDGDANTNIEGKARARNDSVRFRGNANTNYTENSTTMNIYEVVGIFKTIKVRQDFIFNAKTGEVVETKDWYEYPW